MKGSRVLSYFILPTAPGGRTYNPQLMNCCSEKIYNLEPSFKLSSEYCCILRCLPSKDKYGLPCLFLDTLEFGIDLKKTIKC